MPTLRGWSMGLALVVSGAVAPEASAQTFTFERTFPATASTTLEVYTERGRITIHGEPRSDVSVVGRVSVRRGWNVPRDAVTRARATADAPPVEQTGDRIHLGISDDERDRRAATIAYEVRVPIAVVLETRTDSGETRIESVHGPVSVRTQSSTITLDDLADTRVETGSGAVTVRGAGPLRVRTSSSSIDLTQISGDLRVRTESGRVTASMTAAADADVATGSSAITVDGVKGGLAVTTRSGHVRVSGTPNRPWEVTTGSSAIDTRFAREAAFTIDATSGSGDVEVEQLDVDGAASKGLVTGLVEGGGPTVLLRTRSGRIALRGST